MARKATNAQKQEPVKTEEQPIVQSAPVNDIRISVNDAEKIIELHRKIEKADCHFKTCQSANFREYVQSVFKAQTIVNAINRLSEAVEKAKGVN